MAHKFKDTKAFYSTRDEDERAKDKGKVFTMRLNDQEMRELKDDMKLLHQVKASTTMKQMWRLARFVLHQDKIGLVLQYIQGNIRRNEKSGIVDAETEIESNVTQNH